MTNKILLIDGNSIVYRAYYGMAFASPVLKNSKAFPVNAIITFMKMLCRAIDTYNPTHLFVAFDAGKKTKRHDLMPDYKGNRIATPSELLVQLPVIKEILDLMNIKAYELPGIEADDIIGSLSEKFKDNGKIMIMSSDKDFYQLVNEETSIIAPQNGSKPNKIITLENFKETLGYNPSQVPDIKGLVGDSSDNLKGVAGIGPKTAVKLIDKYGSLENLYQNLAEITGLTHEKLKKDHENALLCKEITTIWRDIDIPYTLSDIEILEKYEPKLFALLQNYEINSLFKLFEKRKNDKTCKKDLSFDNLVL